MYVKRMCYGREQIYAKCKRLTHYACTKLPAYQISLFLLKGYRIYQCRVCVGEIHEDILDNCHTDSNMRDLKDLKVKCQKLEDEIKEKSNTIAAMKEVEERNINNTEEDASRSVEYLSKSTQVSNPSYTENTENKLDKDTDNINMSSNNLSNDIQMLVNRRFDKIEENIDRIILWKLEEKVLESTATKLTDAIEQNRSYASSLRANPEVVNNFESIIRSTKNNELIQEKERKKRAANLIIYGINEEFDEQ